MNTQDTRIQKWRQARYRLIVCTLFAGLIFGTPGTVRSAWGAAGDLDPEFGDGGKAISDFKGEAWKVALQPDGKIVVFGNAGTKATGMYPALLRYNTDGTPDTSFGPAGTGQVIIPDENIAIPGSQCGALTVQPDGKIVVVASVSLWPSQPTHDGQTQAPRLRELFDIIVWRYMPEGTFDPHFGKGGKITTDLSNSSDDFPTGIALQPDGKIVVAGFVDTINNRDFAIVRYHSDGSLDRSFGTKGIVVTDFGSRFDEGWAVAIQPDGKILVAGFTVRPTTRYDFAIVRYDEDGMLDTTFGENGTGKVTTCANQNITIMQPA